MDTRSAFSSPCRADEARAQIRRSAGGAACGTARAFRRKDLLPRESPRMRLPLRTEAIADVPPSSVEMAVEVEPDDVDQLLLEPRIIRDLERVDVPPL